MRGGETRASTSRANWRPARPCASRPRGVATLRPAAPPATRSSRRLPGEFHVVRPETFVYLLIRVVRDLPAVVRILNGPEARQLDAAERHVIGAAGVLDIRDRSIRSRGGCPALAIDSSDQIPPELPDVRLRGDGTRQSDRSSVKDV